MATRTQIYLTDEQRARLSERARATGRPVSQLVRDAIDGMLAADDEEPQVRRLLAGMEEIPIDRRVADRAGLLRRQLRGLRLPDALIASTALVHALALHTKNRRDFQRVPELRLH